MLCAFLFWCSYFYFTNHRGKSIVHLCMHFVFYIFTFIAVVITTVIPLTGLPPFSLFFFLFFFLILGNMYLSDSFLQNYTSFTFVVLVKNI